MRSVFLYLVLLSASCFSQRKFEIHIHKTVEECEKAVASLNVKEVLASDSLFITWSNGVKNVNQIVDLSAGPYSVYVKIKYAEDTVIRIQDTVIYFEIEKEECEVFVSKYFSPNDDGYNDRLNIGNIEKYPEFELQVFNKWGQRVHHQKNKYEPWDGKWGGFDLPDGAYFYIFLYKKDNKDHIEKGDITILR